MAIFGPDFVIVFVARYAASAVTVIGLMQSSTEGKHLRDHEGHGKATVIRSDMKSLLVSTSYVCSHVVVDSCYHSEFDGLEAAESGPTLSRQRNKRVPEFVHNRLWRIQIHVLSDVGWKIFVPKDECGVLGVRKRQSCEGEAYKPVLKQR